MSTGIMRGRPTVTASLGVAVAGGLWPSPPALATTTINLTDLSRMLSNLPPSGHVVRQNRFDRHGTPVDLFRMTPGLWEKNRFADTGQAIAQPVVEG